MKNVSLDRVREKVEAGERLTDDELELLHRAAAAEPGPSLKLAVAHAFLNADQVPRAIEWLEALRRDFPREVQVRLGLARAYATIERWSETERALNEALALNPGDPEALKGLAVVAMRRGELARARAHVEQVLAVDPFDGEARLLRTELESADAGIAPPAEPQASRLEFTRALLERLKQQSTPYLVQNDSLLVRLGKGGVARLDLDSLHAAYAREKRPLAEAVEAIARELAERSLGVPRTREAVLERVRPVLRDGSFLERAVGAVRREGPGGLFVFYVLDDSELVRYLPEGALASRGLSLEEVDAAAWRNLEAHPAEPRAVGVNQGQLVLEAGKGLYALAEGDGHDGARLFTSAQRRLLEQSVGPPPWRVFLGRREVCVLCRDDDARAVADLSLLAPADDGIAGAFVLHEGGRLERR